MAKLFVCKICGEPYIGGTAPDDCPFCGAPKQYLGVAEDYSTLWGMKLTPKETENMKKTLELEINATAYYDKVAKAHKKYSKYNRLYKQFMRVETEHADVAAKFLGVSMPELKGEDPKGTIEADLKRTSELEAHATKLYNQFMAEATDEKVKKLYHALAHAEKGHLEISEQELKK